MKFNFMAGPLKRRRLFKILLAMKLTVLFIIAAMVNVSAKTYSQNINIHENRTLTPYKSFIKSVLESPSYPTL